MTKDGHLVAMHDNTVNRTTNGTGNVSDMTLEQIKALDAGNGQTVPTLDEILTRYKLTTNYYIETKTPFNPAMDAELLRVLGQHGLIGENSRYGKVIIQSFSALSLKNIHESYPEVKKVKLGSIENVNFEELSEYAYGVGPDHNTLTLESVKAAQAHGLKVHPYTVNTESAIKRMIDFGVDGVFSDYPDLVRLEME